MLKPFKDRKINLNKPVKVYRRLNGKDIVEYSILQGKTVVAHGINFTLTDVKAIVNKSGQKEVRRKRQKNVHAFLLGYLVDGVLTSEGKKITYDPYQDDFFKVDEYEFVSSDNVVFTEDGVFSNGVVIINSNI